jgi:hypothetical protein
LQETDGKEAGVSNRVQNGVQLVRGRLSDELTEIDADGGAFEELWSGGDARAQLMSDGFGVDGAEPNLSQSHLTDADLARSLLSGAAVLHQDGVPPDTVVPRAILADATR